MRISNAVAAHHRPGFGKEQFTIMGRDGSMWSFNGAPWINAYNAHPELGGAVREFVDFEWDDDGNGWVQYADDGAFYHWRGPVSSPRSLSVPSNLPRARALSTEPVYGELVQAGDIGSFINPTAIIDLPENSHVNTEEE